MKRKWFLILKGKGLLSFSWKVSLFITIFFFCRFSVFPPLLRNFSFDKINSEYLPNAILTWSCFVFVFYSVIIFLFHLELSTLIFLSIYIQSDFGFPPKKKDIYHRKWIQWNTLMTYHWIKFSPCQKMIFTQFIFNA